MIRLTDIDTRAPKHLDKDVIKEKTKEITREIADYQEKLFAESKQSLLVVFQGMDSSGKDGSTHAVFKYCSPVGLNAVGFGKPTDKEFAHDFLWRVHKHTPGKGEICVFLRSHYEDVLIQRVHKWIDEERVDARFDAINAFEQLLEKDNNTKILKFYLHLSKDKQLEKLRERTTLERKFWKHNDGDWNEREHWDSYMKCYEDVINRSVIPWQIVPVDQRWYRNYFIAGKVLETLKDMNPKYPALDSKRF